MRPVQKGTAPRTYAIYREAGKDLIAVIGDFCSYCERQIETHLAVEHVRPKSVDPTLINEWGNFLLGCVNCNSSKGDTPIVATDYFWPDVDNTFRAFRYTEAGLVEPAAALTPPEQTKAQATIKLTGLDKDPGNPDPDRRPTDADRRWTRRFEIWQMAQGNKKRLEQADSVQLRQTIVENATARGMFSIWMSVFADDPDMRTRLIAGFIGTAPDCFDAAGNAVRCPRGCL
jgi:uncharacterized protein (TIGR02646 family)